MGSKLRTHQRENCNSWWDRWLYITYLQVSTNNRAETVLSAFSKAVDEYWLPTGIRIDKGGESVLVAEYILGHPDRGHEKHSVIVPEGQLVHNHDSGETYFLLVLASFTS